MLVLSYSKNKICYLIGKSLLKKITRPSPGTEPRTSQAPSVAPSLGLKLTTPFEGCWP